jgi:enoyl-CoA hydratase/carnithine racemase
LSHALLSNEEVEDGILLLTITRPERRNALSSNTLVAMHREIDRIAGDPSVRVVVLTGEGTGFCAGADMKSGPEDSDDLGGVPGGELLSGVTNPTVVTFATQELMANLFEKIHRLRVPVIAAVNGDAHGGGFALALACDIRVASESATFGAVFIKRGVSACDMGTSYHLPRLVGASRSADLLLTGRVFGAAEAAAMGLVIDVVPFGQVVDRALDKAREIAANPPLAVWMTKETMWQTIDAPSLRHALDIENRTQVMCTATGELNEAFRAFREKRPATWRPL